MDGGGATLRGRLKKKKKTIGWLRFWRLGSFCKVFSFIGGGEGGFVGFPKAKCI